MANTSEYTDLEMKLALTKDEFLKGTPFFVRGEPERIYQYHQEPDTNGFISEKMMYKAMVEEIDDDYVLYYLEILGSKLMDELDFNECVNADKYNDMCLAITKPEEYQKKHKIIYGN